jgi:magnesium-transporting ATPase (P-type)
MKHFGESLIYTAVNILGSFITLIFTFGSKFIGEDKVLSKEEIFGKGEIIIICVPLCFTVIYSLYSNKRKSGSLTFSSILFWLTLALVFFCTWFYSRFTSENFRYTENLYVFSTVMIIWTTFSVFFSKYLDPPSTDLLQDRKDDLKNLMGKLAKINRD